MTSTGESSGGVGDPSESSAAPGGESKAPSHEPATGDVEKDPAPEKAPQQKMASEEKSEEKAVSSVPPKGASGGGDPEPTLISKAAPRQKMRPCLGGLTDSLTLTILQELDFRSLAAVKSVCHRFGRIANDPSLLRRVTRVQWTSGFETYCTPPWGSFARHVANDKTSLIRTDCSQLGPIRLPANGKQARGRFREILERLLEGGAPLVSLQTPANGHGRALTTLPTLFAKHKVRLEALACSEDRVTKFLSTQPGLNSLCLPDVHWVSGIFPESPSSLRHLSLTRAREWEDLLKSSAPKLRSVIFRGHTESAKIQSLLKDARKGGLLFQAVGEVRLGANSVCDVAFAVEGFRREERGRPFLVDGKPWDAWDEAKHHIPQPTDDWDIVRRFLHAEAERQWNETILNWP